VHLTPSLVELNRPLAYNVTQDLPPHTFRNGDPVRIEEHVATTKTKSKKAKEDSDNAVEGVVYRVGPEKVIVAVSEGKDVELPERLRL
jgi:DNA polymerase alpha-associated DNA helicase A